MKLLPCPFCGGRPETERFGNGRQSTIYACVECGCRLETGETFNHGARWNERPLHDELVAMVGRYEKALDRLTAASGSFTVSITGAADELTRVRALLARAKEASGG